MSYVAVGVGVASLAYGVYNAESQKAKANKIEKSLKQPVYQIPQEFYQNRELARQMAQIGLPQSVKNNFTNQINQNEAGGIQALNNSANPGSGVAAVVGQGDAAAANLEAEDAQAKQNNQRFFVEQNAQLGNQKIQQQQANVFDPYTQHYNEAAALRGAGMQNENTAVQDTSRLAGLAIQYGLFSNTNTQQPTFGQVNQTQPLTATGGTSYQTPQLTNQLPGGNGISPNEQFNPQLGFNPYQFQ